MKKILTMILTAMLLLALVGCNGNSVTEIYPDIYVSNDSTANNELQAEQQATPDEIDLDALPIPDMHDVIAVTGNMVIHGMTILRSDGSLWVSGFEVGDGRGWLDAPADIPVHIMDNIRLP